MREIKDFGMIAAESLVELLGVHGVKRVFMSPGSRNAPLIYAVSCETTLSHEIVVDERVAAFAALGYSITSGEPTALICTSGSAPLNYAPAVAEAFYRRTSLIVVTADRPVEWIGQDDSQTILQTDIYKNYIKKSVDVPVVVNENGAWHANRMINEALLAATTGRRGPVHINLRLPDASTLNYKLSGDDVRRVEVVTPRVDLEVWRARELGRELASPKKVMIVCGFNEPSSKLNRALGRLAQLPNFAVLCETTSNMHNGLFVRSIDRTLKSIAEDEIEMMRPDVVITLGGALVSRMIKKFLRENPPAEHWHVGRNEALIDCFKVLTRQIEMSADVFFEQLASAMQPHKKECDYGFKWQRYAGASWSKLQSYVAKSPWSDLKAFSVIISNIERSWNVHYSNGTPIRYAQLFGEHEYHRCECNRGVSGIDGCTSTAAGASIAYGKPTLLVSGDTSAIYDLGGLAYGANCKNLRIIVINNGGGGIFRFINATKDMPHREELLCGRFNLPLEKLAQAFGYDYVIAEDEITLTSGLTHLKKVDGPAILEVVTPGELSAKVLKGFLRG